jgi:hypothetical protein
MGVPVSRTFTLNLDPAFRSDPSHYRTARPLHSHSIVAGGLPLMS